MTKGQRLAFRVMQVVIGVVFAAEGITKLLSFRFQVDGFARWGYPAWFMFAVGFFEILGAIGLFTKFRKYAVIGLTILMFGAIYTHIASNEANFIGLAIFMLILIWISTWLKKKETVNH